MSKTTIAVTALYVLSLILIITYMYCLFIEILYSVVDCGCCSKEQWKCLDGEKREGYVGAWQSQKVTIFLSA